MKNLFELFEIIIDYDFIIIANIFCVNYNMNKLFVELLAFLFLAKFFIFNCVQFEKVSNKTFIHITPYVFYGSYFYFIF